MYTNKTYDFQIFIVFFQFIYQFVYNTDMCIKYVNITNTWVHIKRHTYVGTLQYCWETWQMELELFQYMTSSIQNKLTQQCCRLQASKISEF